MYTENDWSFGGIVSGFDSHVEKSIPFYKTFQDMIASMSVYFVKKETKIVDVGTSTGTMISMLKNKVDRNNSFIGIDIESNMINECKNRYSGIDFEEIDATKFNFSNSSVVVCMLTLQFMSLRDREIVLSNIYKNLHKGGCLFVVEKIRTSVCEIHDMYGDLYYDFKRMSFSAQEILDKNKSLRGIMKPITLEENISLIENVGFSKMDVFLKIQNFVGIIAIK